MKRLVLIVPILLLLGCGTDENQGTADPEVIAEADIYGITEITEGEFEVSSQSSVGTATFYQTGNIVTIDINLRGMTPNALQAVHIHSGSVELPGRHWNAGKFVAACSTESLGRAWQKTFIGDVGNVPIGSDGTGSFSLQTDLWRINSGDDLDILDKVIIVHQDPEDFAEECDPYHSHDYIHYNKKIAAGTIELKSTVLKNQQSSVMGQESMPDFLSCN